MIQINEIKLTLDESLNEIDVLKKKISKQYSISFSDGKEFIIRKKAIDARNKSQILFVYNVELSLPNEATFIKKYPKITTAKDYSYPEIIHGVESLDSRITVIGFGPSGIFAALLLARHGYKPLILEQGEDAISRTKEIQKFLETGEFSKKASILFGEGGAGTFSDGKLNSLVNDVRSLYVLEAFVKHGGPKEILYVNKPHIGTDILKKVIVNIRREIESLGGEIRFSSKVTDFHFKENSLTGIVINNKETISTKVCLLGIGHSAKETFKKLQEKEIHLEQKPFSLGVRIEHLQKMINESQYGKYSEHKALGAADYKLFYHSDNGRTCYTFCMCPGGTVMPSNGESGHIVTNGMSESARNKVNSNSALLVSVTPEDFPSKDPLAGFELQEKYEKIAFDKAGKNYQAPVQLVGDFLEEKCSTTFGNVIPSYKPGTSFVKMEEVLPKYVTKIIKEALPYFDSRLHGFASKDAILTGVETRSSSPVRIVRTDTHESSVSGLYPMGEGAGYAGGIMSSAIDGLKTAEIIIMKYKSKE